VAVGKLEPAERVRFLAAVVAPGEELLRLSLGAVAETPSATVLPFRRACVVCGVEFEATNRRQLYHVSACRQRAYRRRAA
jgi:hypothetical protein